MLKRRNGRSDLRAHVRTLKVIYARTRTHISENFPALICTKIASPTRVGTRTHTKGLHLMCSCF